MSLARILARSRAAVALVAAPLLVAVTIFASALPALAAPEDIEEIHRLELEGRKVDAYLRLQELAPKGDPWAQWKLAGYYQYGYAAPANFMKALEWYERAARQGNVDAMLGAAILLDPAFTQAASVPKSRTQAFTWLSIAATKLTKPDEIEVVKGLRDKLKREMSTAELNKALSEAMAFQPAPEPQQ
jgi:TPR repeat protein